MTTNFFIKLDNINGETTIEGHQKDTAIQSWKHSFNQPTSPVRSSSAGGGTVEQANHADFSFTKFLDVASVPLMKACWSGKSIKNAVFTAYRSDGDGLAEYLKIMMYDVIVSTLALDNNAEGQVIETVTLCYGKISYTYTPPHAREAERITATHDIAKKMVH
jgi:type VI secretion system secreted protein Hcp